MSAIPQSPVPPVAAPRMAPTIRDQREFVDSLRAKMIGCRLSQTKFGIKRALNVEQAKQAAETFGASAKAISASKKLLDTRHPKYLAVLNVRSRAKTYWKMVTAPYPEKGIRLLNRDKIGEFQKQMSEFASELNTASIALQEAYDEMKSKAQLSLGDLFDDRDYPRRIDDQFEIDFDFQSIEPPEYLKQSHPELYARELERMRGRLEETVRLAEQAMMTELHKLVSHLVERLAGDVDGKPKRFKDSAIENLNEFFTAFSGLEVGKTEELQAIVARAQDAIKGVNPDDLRDGGDKKLSVAVRLAEVKASMDEMMMDKPKRGIRLEDDEDGTEENEDDDASTKEV
jgi:hypothetical protein